MSLKDFQMELLLECPQCHESAVIGQVRLYADQIVTLVGLCRVCGERITGDYQLHSMEAAITSYVKGLSDGGAIFPDKVSYGGEVRALTENGYCIGEFYLLDHFVGNCMAPTNISRVWVTGDYASPCALRIQAHCPACGSNTTPYQFPIGRHLRELQRTGSVSGLRR